MQRLRLITTLALTTLLAACASTKSSMPAHATIIEPEEATGPFSKADYSTLYLRGTFNWWSAQEPYRVKKVGEDLYKSEAKLVADGQPYQFIFADKSYSQGKSCGYAAHHQSVVREWGTPMQANCKASHAYFYFTPSKTGHYAFYLDHSKVEPQVFIKRVKK